MALCAHAPKGLYHANCTEFREARRWHTNACHTIANGTTHEEYASQDSSDLHILEWESWTGWRHLDTWNICYHKMIMASKQSNARWKVTPVVGKDLAGVMCRKISSGYVMYFTRQTCRWCFYLRSRPEHFLLWDWRDWKDSICGQHVVHCGCQQTSQESCHGVHGHTAIFRRCALESYQVTWPFRSLHSYSVVVLLLLYSCSTYL